MKRRPECLPLLGMPQSNKAPMSRKYLLSPEPPGNDSPKDPDAGDMEVDKEESATNPPTRRDSPSENLELDPSHYQG